MRDDGLTALASGQERILPVWEVGLPDEAASDDLARFLADELRPGDLITLSGGLGSGKTTLARAIVRALSGDPRLEVPSPTFTLMQTYETPRGPVVHADFYRLGGPGELVELGWEEATQDAVCLVEWPDKASSALKTSRLDIHLEVTPGDRGGRLAILVGAGAFAERLVRAKALKALLERAGWTGAARVPLTGDASSRAYERLSKPSGETAILMISPRRPDGPPLRGNRPYSAIAHLAESVHAFVALDRGLRALGFSAPRIYGEELEAGLLLIEDLGDEPVADASAPVPERYAEAVRLLARLHGTMLPHVLPVADDVDHVIPPYDAEALLVEVELLLEWYAPHVAGTTITGLPRSEFIQAWGEALQEIVAGPTTWTLRDYHSPNLLWLAQREGLARVGLLDFQDAVIGHPAYDVVSLLQDARVTVPPELELRLLGLYGRERRAADPAFDMAAFARAYAIMGAQRATKVLGIFTRLDKRDGKPQYLRHLPRIEAYLRRNLEQPALARLAAWYEAHVLAAPAAADERSLRP